MINSNNKFDPNAAASPGSGIFGLPFNEDQSSLVLLPVPWEATTSYGGGTSEGPSAILEASKQVDLFDLEVEKPYEAGICMLDQSPEIFSWNQEAKKHAKSIIDLGGNLQGHPEREKSLKIVNELGKKVNDFVYQETKRLLESQKLLGVVGGDHSVPFGAIKAVAERNDTPLGILHIDAHSDTRQAYEGFQWSHASIMYNVSEEISNVEKIVQIGIRDLCEEELEYTKTHQSKFKIFYDKDNAYKKLGGNTWSKIASEIVSQLPEHIWISFDIDGLDPKYCPGTGTPVPGGLEFYEALYLFKATVKAGKKIIGFDLNEVSPQSDNEWDANVGARILYKLCAYTLASQGKAKLFNN